MNTCMQLVEEYLKDDKQLFCAGVEREGLRVLETGDLATTDHPEAFGIKLDNYHIKTDFCESQPELVTKPMHTVEETYAELAQLTKDLSREIGKRGELFWSQSMPCFLPAEDLIETAKHPGDFAKPLRDYLDCVRELYGAKIQTICGIHYNLSITDSFFEKLQQSMNDVQSLQVFKNEQYMKILRNYTRYHWFVLLLTGASPVLHKSFGYSLPSLVEQGEDLLVGEYATSLRMSRIGYQNKRKVDICYDSLQSFTDSIIRAVDSGALIDEGALFAPIKVKARDNVNYVQSLCSDGVLYIELRDIDLNPFDVNAFAASDMQVLQLFVLYMLSVEEAQYSDWQYEASRNAYQVAEFGLDPQSTLLHCGQEVLVRDVAGKMCKKLLAFNKGCGFMNEKVLLETLNRVENPLEAYATRILKEVKDKGYIRGNLEANS